MRRESSVVIIGSGGREAALAERYSQSDGVRKIIAIPGNDMMQDVSQVKVESVNIEPKNTKVIADFLEGRRREIALVDVAPEDALAEGLVDRLEDAHIPAFGPTKSAARLESDKSYARQFGRWIGLPQPDYMELRYGQTLLDEIEDRFGEGKKVTVKARGLASGKGVIIAEGREEIDIAVERLRSQYRAASRSILIEEFLDGEEFSVFAISDGNSYRIVGSAQDHKRVNDNDTGDNTGGMGAVSNPLILNDEGLMEGVNEILKKVFDGHAKRGQRGDVYKGILYLGGMAVREEGKLMPYVVEFNCRWGDPEAQVLIPGLSKNVDLLALNRGIALEENVPLVVSSDRRVRVAVAAAAKGYPGKMPRGMNKKRINGVEEAQRTGGVKVYGANVKKEDNKYYVNGGRILYVVGEGMDVIEARERAYEGMSQLSVEGDNLHFRTDIGYRDVNRIQASK